MSYIVLRTIRDLNAQTRKSKLSEAVQRAEELIEQGIESELIVCKEIDNSEAKKMTGLSQHGAGNLFVK